MGRCWGHVGIKADILFLWSDRQHMGGKKQLLSYVMLGELDLDGFGVSSGLPLVVEQFLGVAHPGQQLVQCVLELAECQKASLQFVLD